MKITDTALLGALDMLHEIKKGKQYSRLEFEERTQRYAQILANAEPKLKDDPYYKKIFIYCK